MNQSFEQRLPPTRKIIDFASDIEDTGEFHPLLVTSYVTTYRGEKIRTLRYIKNMFQAYLDIANEFDTLTSLDIEKANTATQSAVEDGLLKPHTGNFVSEIEGAHVFKSCNLSMAAIILSVVDEEDIYKLSKEKFTNMFNTAASAKRNNVSLDFSNSFWDDVLIGAFRIKAPEAQIHYLLSHGFAVVTRISCLNNLPQELATIFDNKETLHGIIGLTIRIMAAKGIANEEVLAQWNKKYDQGGVAWHASRNTNEPPVDPIQEYFYREFG